MFVFTLITVVCRLGRTPVWLHDSAASWDSEEDIKHHLLVVVVMMALSVGICG